MRYFLPHPLRVGNNAFSCAFLFSESQRFVAFAFFYSCGMRGDAVGVSRRVLYRYVFPVKLPVRPCKVKVSK